MTAFSTDGSLGSPGMRRLRAGLVASVLLMSGFTVVATTASAPPAAAYPSDQVAINGHGFGHGRGMGQFGALGYALKGSPYTDILGHFYSNTTAGGMGDDLVTVQLVANDNLDTIGVQENGNFTTDAGPPPAGTKALRVRKIAPHTFAIDHGPGCGGGCT